MSGLETSESAFRFDSVGIVLGASPSSFSLTPGGQPQERRGPTNRMPWGTAGGDYTRPPRQGMDSYWQNLTASARLALPAWKYLTAPLETFNFDDKLYYSGGTNDSGPTAQSLRCDTRI